MNEQETLAHIIASVHSDPQLAQEDLNAAAKVLAAGYRKPRTIATMDELDALPEGAVVLVHGIAWQHAGGHWWSVVNDNPHYADELIEHAADYSGTAGAIIVVYVPDEQQ